VISALRSEARKLATTKMWWIIALAVAGYMAFIAIVMVVAFNAAPESMSMDSAVAPPDALARAVYSLPASLAYFGTALIGALLVTTEFRHSTLTPTFLAEPRRGLVLWSKLLIGAVVGVLTGALIVVATVGPAAGMLAILGEPTYLGSMSVGQLFARPVLTLTLWAVVGVGFGALLRSQVAAIVVLLVFTQFVEPILRTLPEFTGMVMNWLKFLPGAAGEGVAGGSMYAVVSSKPIELLSTWPAIGTMAAYAVVLTGLGYFVSFRRDVT
jgi:ABC-type transport system involved in multi-copper enzyme maturation permease subunit